MKRTILFPLGKVIFLFLISITLFWGCAEKQEKGETKSAVKRLKQEKLNSYELAKYVSSYPTGDVLPDTPLIIRFTDNMVEFDTVGKKENKAKFTISPKLNGKAVWLDRQQLEFIPDTKLKPGKRYNFELDFKAFYSDTLKITPLKFSVNVLKQRISFFKADFVLSESNREEVTYEGELTFLLDMDLETVDKATTLKVDNKKVNLNWTQDEKKFTFKSEVMLRDDATQPIDFKIESGPLKIDEDLIRNSTLSSLHEMVVILVKQKTDQEIPGFEIVFSDILDRNQDLSGYITITPETKVNLQKFGNRVLVNGDFSFGKSYNLKIKAGVKNSFGEDLVEDYPKVISFNDQNPQVLFAQNGSFMPSGNNKKLQFQTMNARSVRVYISKIYENNLMYFLQRNNFIAKKTDDNDYYYDFNYFGEQIYSGSVEIGNLRNQWVLSELDLSELIPKDNTGMYIVEIKMNHKDSMYRGVQVLGRNNYYSDPTTNNYYHRMKAVKTVLMSDLGVTVKQAGKDYQIYVNDVMSSNPVSGAKVMLKSYQNQVIEEGSTNGDGMVLLTAGKTTPYFVEVKSGKQRTIVKIDEMRQNTSNYEVGGVQYSSNGTRGYIYTERGVYRPGDPINLSMIFRNVDNTFPMNHPIKLKIYNPRHQEVLNRTIRTGQDGFYNYEFTTNTTDPTGNWQVRIESGSAMFYHELKIETVVAERLKIEMEPEKEVIDYKDTEFKVDLKADYLFGAPGSNLAYSVKYDLIDINKEFNIAKYKKFRFRDRMIDFSEISETIVNSKLDLNGGSEFTVKLPENLNVPSALMIKLEADVKEEGGRSSKKKTYLEYNPYPAYAGLNMDGGKWAKPGKKRHFQTILLDPEGEPLSNQKVRIRVYHNRSYWWWEYDRYNYNPSSFKTGVNTHLIKEDNYISSDKLNDFSFTPDHRGQYLIEVTHIGAKGELHKSSMMFRTSWWGNPKSNVQDAGMIDLKSDKNEYKIGETALISFPTPKEGNILVSLEKGDEIMKSWWHKPSGKENTTLKIPLTSEMTPNVYVSVAVLQPQQQSDNDRPVRMYGYLPIKVFDENTKQNVILELPEILRPNKSFKAKIQANQKTQFTIAVVDEGLLSLTDFESPDAWEEFYKKQKLGVITSDNYGYIIGANRADVFKSHKVGGGMSLDKMRKEQLIPNEADRFKPVCMFQGPLYTDENGYAEVEFDMPEYMGAVRVMVVTAEKGSFGSASKTVEVKEDLVLLPTIPRVLAPGDKFRIPVEVFATTEGVGDVKIKLEVDLPIKLIGESTRTLNFEKEEQKSIYFEAEVIERVGISHIKISAEYGNSEIESNTEISIRPLSARIYRSEEKECVPGTQISFEVPDEGILGTNKAYIVVNRLPRINLGRRLNWLIRYPYGCVEQTTSAAFPQLYLSEFVKNENIDDSEIVNNITDAVRRLSLFQTPSGGFSYWPGNSKVSGWGTNYAGHFLLEADEAGYHVSKELINNWIRYQQQQAKNYQYQNGSSSGLREQVYRLYLLSKAKKSEMGAMNYLRENHLSKLDDTMRWLLAAAYKLSGANTEAERLSKSAGIITSDYLEHSGTYGSGLRDKAMILEAMIIFGDSPAATNMFRNISEQISEEHWYSTQTTGYSLLALGKYIKNFLGDKNVKMEGQIDQADGTTNSFISSDYVFRKEITQSFGKQVDVELYNVKGLKKCFVTLEWSGVPMFSSEVEVKDGIVLTRSFSVADLNNLEQGEVVEMYLKVRNLESRSMENMALVQLLPSGWEIENERINPDKVGHSNDNNSVEYTDIRDDRIMWFFDLGSNKSISLKVKVRNVTEGTFYMPATSCEVMYDNRYKASLPGRTITIKK